MAVDPFLDEDRVLTPEAFHFVLANELKRATRSQNYLTLLVIEAKPRTTSEGGQAIREILRLIGREVRETDLLSPVADGQVSVVLLDADLANAMRVVDRLMARFEHYQFTTPAAIRVGAACCPTHGIDAESLHRAALARPVPTSRESRGNPSNAQ